MKHRPISVVIPAYNEERTLGMCLSSLLGQTVLPSEVIVVDNASDDTTPDIVKWYIEAFHHKGIHLRLVSEPKRGVARARNAGFYASQNQIIASTDADTIVDPHWIELIDLLFQKYPQAVAVTGSVEMSDAPFPIPQITHAGWILLVTKLLEAYAGFRSVSTANAAFKKEAFIASGGFNEQITSPVHIDDTELSSRIAKFGPIITHRNLVVYSSFRRYRTPRLATSTTLKRAQAWREIKHHLHNS